MVLSPETLTGWTALQNTGYSNEEIRDAVGIYIPRSRLAKLKVTTLFNRQIWVPLSS